MKKKCSKCLKIKSIKLFNCRKDSKDGYNGKCKACIKKYCYKYKHSDKYTDQTLDLSLRKKYGINLDMYNEMLEKQNGVCAICGHPQPPQFFRLAVDHCHKTGKVRGLLCQSCNGMLGLAKDNIEVLAEAIEYLGRMVV